MKKLCMGLMLGMSLGLSACEKPAEEVAMSGTVVGPDMDKIGPFQTFQRITFAAVRAEDTPAESKLMRIELQKRNGEDVATLYNLLSDHKSYLAGVTYHPFTPVIAETNAERKDYWIVGMNLSRTPDRSVYSVMRFPQGTDFSPGQSPKVEYLKLDCSDLDFALQPVASFDPANAEKSFAPEFKPEAGECEFNSLNEAYKVTALALRKYDQVKHYPEAPKADWKTLTVTVE